MGPEESMEIQSNLASTIAMAFDECPPANAERKYIEASVERTTRWLERCICKLEELNKHDQTLNKQQMLFGINQGGILPDIRIEHAKRISEFDLPGYAIGGLAVGETHNEMYHVLDSVVPYMPENKPVYLMGVGTPDNLLEAIERGVDFFDCVLPARNGRHGQVYTSHGKLNLLNKKFETDDTALDPACNCPACRDFSRAYIRHLFKAGELLAMRLCVMHNLHFYNGLMKEVREAITNSEFAAFKRRKLNDFSNH